MARRLTEPGRFRLTVIAPDRPGLLADTTAVLTVAGLDVSGEPSNRATITVTARDQLGLLWAICRWFADHGVSIEAVHATTTAGVARDTFVVLGACVPEELSPHLSHVRLGHLLRV